MARSKKAKATFDYGEPRLEWEDIEELRKKRWPNNPKEHDLAFLGEAYATNGMAEFPTVDEGTGRMVAGHGRVEKLEAMKAAGDDPPARVQVKNGKWLVPVVRGMTFPEPEKHLLASNRGTELGGWNNDALTKFLSRLDKDFVGTGFRENDLVRFMAKGGGDLSAGNTDPDAVPDAVKTRSKLGDLWILGEHRLLCGDSTKQADVSRLMGKHRAVMMATDPPYGVDYTDEVRVGADRAHVRPQRKQKWNVSIDNDEKTGADIQPFLEAVFRAAVANALIKKAAWYLWHAQMTQGFFAAAAAAAAAAAVQIHRQIIWVKPSLLFGFGDYHWRHELAFYGWVKGSRPEFYGERNQTTLWEVGHDVANGARVHPNQKPVKLFEIPINNHTKPGEICYEPFSGSGTQIIAGQRLGRRVFAMEIDPKYVDVAITRWEAFTGKKAKLAKG